MWTPEPVGTGPENLASAGSRSPDQPARSESLYRLPCPGPRNLNTVILVEVNLDVDQLEFRLVRPQTFTPCLCMCHLKFRRLLPIIKKKNIFINAVLLKQCCQIVPLPRHDAAISSFPHRRSSKACLPVNLFHRAQKEK